MITALELAGPGSHICDPTRANEALWGRYQNWHFKFNVLFNIYKEHFATKNDFHIIFLSKVIDNLISNCVIILKINYQDMGRQSYWFVHKPIEDIKNNWIKTLFPVTYWLVWVYELIEFMSKFVFKHTLIFEKFWPYLTFLLITRKLILPQRASLAGVGSHIPNFIVLRAVLKNILTSQHALSCHEVSIRVISIR